MTDTTAPTQTLAQKIEAAISNTVSTIDNDLVTFIGKVKTGAEVVVADVDAAIKAIASHVSSIDALLVQVEKWLPEIEAVATAAGAPPSVTSGVNAALADARQVVNGLDAVAAASNAGADDVTAVVAGVTAVQQAASSASNLVANLALVPTPNATTKVS